jgi:hypothetical protein
MWSTNSRGEGDEEASIANIPIREPDGRAQFATSVVHALMPDSTFATQAFGVS